MPAIEKLEKHHIESIIKDLPSALCKVPSLTSRAPYTFHIGGGSALSLKDLRDQTSDIDLHVTDKDNKILNICAEAPYLVKQVSASLDLYGSNTKPYVWHEKDLSHEKDTPTDLSTFGGYADLRRRIFDPPLENYATRDSTVVLMSNKTLLLQKSNIVIYEGNQSCRSSKMDQDIADAARLCEIMEITDEKKFVTFINENSELTRTLKKLNGNYSDGVGRNLQEAWIIIKEKIIYPYAPSPAKSICASNRSSLIPTGS